MAYVLPSGSWWKRRMACHTWVQYWDQAKDLKEFLSDRIVDESHICLDQISSTIQRDLVDDVVDVRSRDRDCQAKTNKGNS